MADRPPEPPIGSIVVDVVDAAWQRDHVWWWQTGCECPLSWADLHGAFGPLTVLREGPGHEHPLAENDKMREVIKRAEGMAHAAALFKGGFGDSDFVVGLIEWAEAHDRLVRDCAILARMLIMFSEYEIEDRAGGPMPDSHYRLFREAREDYA